MATGTGHAEWMHRFHLGARSVSATGALDVQRGTNWPARCLAALLRFPAAGSAVPLTVRIDRSGPGPDRWRRQIGARSLDSRQLLRDGVLTEFAGPAELRMHLTTGPDRLELTPAGGALRIGRLRIPLPRALAPHTSALVTIGTGDRPAFEVTARIWVPSIGLLLAYRGHVHEEGTGDV